jgi:hypothetical protein
MGGTLAWVALQIPTAWWRKAPTESGFVPAGGVSGPSEVPSINPSSARRTGV